MLQTKWQAWKLVLVSSRGQPNRFPALILFIQGRLYRKERCKLQWVHIRSTAHCSQLLKHEIHFHEVNQLPGEREECQKDNDVATHLTFDLFISRKTSGPLNFHKDGFSFEGGCHERSIYSAAKAVFCLTPEYALHISSW